MIHPDVFANVLLANGWSEIDGPWKYRKGDWQVVFDTSSWMEVGTICNPRVFDVPVPESSREEWTLNLIEHLCQTDDQIHSSKKP